jgi:hypothetical protein
MCMRWDVNDIDVERAAKLSITMTPSVFPPFLVAVLTPSTLHRTPLSVLSAR